jgi:hypothetical protein
MSAAARSFIRADSPDPHAGWAGSSSSSSSQRMAALLCFDEIQVSTGALWIGVLVLTHVLGHGPVCCTPHFHNTALQLACCLRLLSMTCAAKFFPANVQLITYNVINPPKTIYLRFHVQVGDVFSAAALKALLEALTHCSKPCICAFMCRLVTCSVLLR